MFEKLRSKTGALAGSVALVAGLLAGPSATVVAAQAVTLIGTMASSTPSEAEQPSATAPRDSLNSIRLRPISTAALTEMAGRPALRGGVGHVE